MNRATLLLAADLHPGGGHHCQPAGGLRRFCDIPDMWQLSKLDTVVWWTTMLASTLITMEIRLLVGLCFALLCIIFRMQRCRAMLLGKVSNTDL